LSIDGLLQPRLRSGCGGRPARGALQEDPANPNGKRFGGSAIWRIETISPGPGRLPELAIRADIEILEFNK
jgi:hypothetical protein